MTASSNRSPRYTLALIATIIWLALLLGLYYWVHKPITPALARAAGGALLDTAVMVTFLLAAGALGRRVLRPLPLDTWSVAERLAGSAVIGLGTLSLLILAVGAFFLNTISMIALLAVIVIGLRRDVLAWLFDRHTLRLGKLPARGWPRWMAYAALALAAIAFLIATLPPTMWDVLTYHLAGAEAYVDHGRFYAVPHNHFLGFPQLVDTLYAGQLALTGHLAGSALLHWLIGALMLVFTGGYTNRHAGPGPAWTAVIVLMASLTIWLEMTFAYVDLMLMALAMIGMATLESWRANRTQSGWLILLGVVAGFAMSTKYTAIWLAVMLGVLMVWASRRDGIGAIIRRSLILGGVATLVLLPWLVRNTIWYDSPVYPLVFEASEMYAIRQDWYSDPGSGMLFSSQAWQVPLMPLMATIFGVENAGIYASDIGPLFALLLPLIFLVWGHLEARERVVCSAALALTLPLTLAWITSGALLSYINIQTRLVLYALPPLAVTCGIILNALNRLPEKPLNLGFVVRAMVVLVVVFTLTNAVRILLRSGFHAYYSADANYQEDFLAFKLGWHYEAMRQINNLPPGPYVRFLWEPRSLSSDDDTVHCRPDSLMDAWYYARRTVQDGSPAAISAAWQADQRPDFLLVYEHGRQFEEDNQDLYTDSDWIAWDAFVSEQIDEVWRGVDGDGNVQYIIYTWRPPSP